MSLRVLYTIGVLFSLLNILKAACPKSGKGRLYRPRNCNSSLLDCDIYEHLESTISTRVVPSLYTVVFLLGLPANGIALWMLIFKVKKMPSTVLLINMAAADLFFMLALPFKITYHFMENNWIFGEAACRIVTAMLYGNMYCSVLFLMAISIDRYIGLVHPFCAKSLHNSKHSTCGSIAIWLVAIATVSGFTLVPQTKEFDVPNKTTCHEVWAICAGYEWYTQYFLGLFIGGFVIPSVVILFCYVLILVTLAKKKESYRRVIGLISLVLVTFIVCFTPSNVLLVLHYLETEWEKHNQLYLWYTLGLSLTSLNSCIDPFIYCYASKDFWALVKDTLCIRGKGYSMSSEGTKRSKLTLSSDKEMVKTGA
ncbi:proteinase-activated receptor 3-like [Dendropsophus ebraccatus]|uniref:proteinase-activated receptor 3-like n=1 Tax=Dendropsophus ebraccatus TaxID=150705 RepID=UPI003831DBB7